MSESVYEDDNALVNRFESAVGRTDSCPLGEIGEPVDPSGAGLPREGEK